METTVILDELRVINKKKSYEKIAKELGVSSQTVYRWLKNRNSPSGLALEKVEKYVKKARS